MSPGEHRPVHDRAHFSAPLVEKTDAGCRGTRLLPHAADPVAMAVGITPDGNRTVLAVPDGSYWRN